MVNPFDQIYSRLSNIENLLLDLKHSSLDYKSHSEEDQLLTIHQAAELLSLAVPTLYSLVSKSEIPVNKRGKRLYFSRQELTNWVKTGRKKTAAEINAEAQSYLHKKNKRG
jgi:excisionase family DNA binding protein